MGLCLQFQFHKFTHFLTIKLSKKGFLTQGALPKLKSLFLFYIINTNQQKERVQVDLIKANNLVKTYGKKETQVDALKGISFSVAEGEIVCILGRSGAGKSTLLNILGGMDVSTSGSLFFKTNNISTYSEHELIEHRRKEIGFVFQFYNLISNLNVYENVEIARFGKNSFNSKEILASVGLDKRLKNFPSQLSGGEQQRVAIARAIVKNPDLLLCDEPTGALDIKTGIEVLKIIQNLNKEHKKTIIIVTHNSEIAKIADHVIELKDGQIFRDMKNEKPLAVSELKW